MPRLDSATHIRDFGEEAEARVGLGVHPNTVSCACVRQLDGAPRVFAGWVDGCSLAEATVNDGTTTGSGTSNQMSQPMTSGETMRIRSAVPIAVAGILTAVPMTVAATPASATTMNCMYSGPVVGHPGMQYICYAHHDDGSTEVFYAPGPSARP